MAKKKRKWFEPGKPLGWRKDDSQEKRIRIALRNRNGDKLATARGLTALANVTRDMETKEKARKDAAILYKKYAKGK